MYNSADKPSMSWLERSLVIFAIGGIIAAGVIGIRTCVGRVNEESPGWIETSLEQRER